MKDIFIVRDLFVGDKAILGTCVVYDEEETQLFKSESVERGWVDNQRGISCIPSGSYPVVLEMSDRFGKELWEIKDVPGRSECKFHSANYAKQLNGCIALGKERQYVDEDEVLDVTHSRNTMDAFHKALEGETKARLHVIDLPSLI